MFVRLFICFYSIFLFREKIFRYICINLKFGIMRNLNCHIGHIRHTAVYTLELQRVAMVTDSVTDTVTDFC